LLRAVTDSVPEGSGDDRRRKIHRSDRWSQGNSAPAQSRAAQCPTCKRKPRHRGFTLLELVVVLALATALLTIVPPLITAAFPGVELKSSSRRVASGLRLAREEAIRSGRDVAFTLDLENRSFKVDGNFREVSLPEGLDLKLTAAESEMSSDHLGSVRFFPDGSSTGGRIIVARANAGWQIGVQWLTGRILLAPWEAE
jgi:general secretion pathway protein H